MPSARVFDSFTRRSSTAALSFVEVRAEPVALPLGFALVPIRRSCPSFCFARARFDAAPPELLAALQMLLLRALLSLAPELVLEARDALVRRVGLLLRLKELPLRFREALARFLRSRRGLFCLLALTGGLAARLVHSRRICDALRSRYRRGRAAPAAAPAAAPKLFVARPHQVREVSF